MTTDPLFKVTLSVFDAFALAVGVSVDVEVLVDVGGIFLLLI